MSAMLPILSKPERRFWSPEVSWMRRCHWDILALPLGPPWLLGPPDAWPMSVASPPEESHSLVRLARLGSSVLSEKLRHSERTSTIRSPSTIPQSVQITSPEAKSSL